MADLNTVLKETQKLNGSIRSLLRLSTYDDYDDLSGLHIDYEDGQQLFLQTELREIMEKLSDVTGRIAYLSRPVKETSRLHMNMLDGIPNNEKPRVIQNYVILESEVVGHKEFVLAQNPNAPQPYVTWERNMQEDERRGEENFYWGKYFCDPEAAEKNFHDRADAEREYLREYCPSLLQSLRKNQEEIARPVAPAGGREKGEAAL